MKLIEVQDLYKTFDDVTAVDGLSISMEQGEIYGLLGPNGAGKSTLIKLLVRALHPDKGDIQVFGKSLDAETMAIKQGLGIVPQDLAIYEDLTAEENVRFFAALYGLKGKELKDNVKQALSFVGLEDYGKKLPKTFSGGMKRRLNIACALAHKPQLLILDEPTVGVDPQSRYKIISSIKKLNQEGMSIIYTSHYMEEVEELCSKVGIIDHGKLIAEGTIAELENIVTDRSTTKLIVKNPQNINEALLEALKSIKGVIQVTAMEETISIDSLKEHENLEQVLATLLAHDIKIRDINLQKNNLESVFLSMTGRSLRD